MTKTIGYAILLACFAALCFAACKKDKPKTVPTVTTLPVTEGTTNSGKGGGKITNTGNDEITAKGLVYSSTVSTPTIADNKTVVTTTGNDFESEITGLTSGTTYHVRAYATNSVGTAYGNVVDFVTGNSAPVASGVSISGMPEVDNTVTAIYSYSDAENNPESGTIFKWYIANDASGGGETEITGATNSTFTITDAYEGKFIAVAVTPNASAGTTAGAPVKSAYVEVGAPATSVTFTYNGAEVTYGIITSSTTGRKWLDRNLGAPGVPTAADNYANYGDLFQWGRLADGHQLINRVGPANTDMSGVNGATSFDPPYQLSSTDNPGTNLFIVNPSGDVDNPIDWRDPQNNSLWQGVAGINNPCPTGWRLPTKTEWLAEAFTDLADGFNKLKLTYTGVRTGQGNAFFQNTSNGNYWSSDIGVDNVKQAIYVRVNASAFEQVEQPRANAYAVRCIKN